MAEQQVALNELKQAYAGQIVAPISVEKALDFLQRASRGRRFVRETRAGVAMWSRIDGPIVGFQYGMPPSANEPEFRFQLQPSTQNWFETN